MKEKIFSIVEKNINSELFFVFPSEITARSVMEQLLLSTERAVLDRSRFISWDKFKELSQIHKRDRRPVNRLVLRLFAEDLLCDVRQSNEYIPYFYEKNNSFSTKILVTNLVTLLSKINLVSSLRGGVMSPGFYQGVEFVRARYLVFLEKNNYFDPNLEDSAKMYDFKPAIIFFPELILDFEEFRAVEGFANLVQFAVARPGSAALNSLTVHDSVAGEVSCTLRQIRELLDSGVDPSEIVVSCCGDEDYLGFFAEFADGFGVPLNLKTGKPLSEYVAASFFRGLADVCKRDFLFSQVRGFVSNPVFPIKQRDLFVEFLRDGSQRCVIAGEKILLYKADPYIVAFFEACKGIIASEGFSTLLERVDSFLKEFTSVEFIDKEDVRPSFERILVVLRELRDIESELGDYKVNDCFEFFMETLTQQVYVPQSRGNGVAIYKYRVAAGGQPLHHFVVGFSQSGSEVKRDALAFLPEIVRAKHFDKDFGFQDFSDDFFNAYILSGESVEFSMSQETQNGTMIVPMWFAKDGNVNFTGDFILPIAKEKNYWEGGCSDFFLTERILKTYSVNLEISTPLAIESFIVDNVAEDLPFLFENPEDPSSRLLFSATNLNDLYNCPFAFYFSRVLDCYDEYPFSKIVNYREEGNLFHKAAELYFEWREKSKDGLVDISSLVDFVMENYSYKICPDIRKKAFRIRFTEDLNIFVRDIASYHEKVFGCSPEVSTEEKFYTRIESICGLDDDGKASCLAVDVALRGAIDRVEISDGKAAVYDYKTSSFHGLTKKTFFPKMDEQRVEKNSWIQLPFYSLVLENLKSCDVVAGFYYSFKDHAYKVGFGQKTVSSSFNRNKLELYYLLGRYILYVKEKVLKNDFGIREDAVCDRCQFTQVCRKTYRVE
ncbi:MAG: PD-(D/E)XK nuclease family protein [Spirochaetales bacterium]|nr:PD-(D/E)XK nuclease family protein [Spirochaetales bacterium]